MSVAIRAEGLGKRYRLGASTASTLREALASVPGTIRGRGASRQGDDVLWAIHDVSFDIEPGQVVGIIGANGAGKSTLLKVLARITEPTAGQAVLRGRVGSLLEVGTGFHPELTGRENIYLSGAILGMRRREIDSRFDEIVAFAEIERFLDTPVKHYSDGMHLRLAFAVAAHLEPEILFVDEVLAVGDARFQRKCLGRMSDLADRDGRTVLVVSHVLGVLQRLCDRTLRLDRGRLVDDGPTAGVIARYLSDTVGVGGAGDWIDVSGAPRRGSGEVRFERLRYRGGDAATGGRPHPDGRLEVDLVVTADGPRTVPSFGIVVSDGAGARLVNADILTVGETLALEPGENQVLLSIDALHLHPGTYDLSLWAGETAGEGYDLIDPATTIEVVARDDAGFGVTPSAEYGSVTCSVHVERR